MQMQEIKIILKEGRSKVVLPDNLIFGKLFTDHLFVMDYDQEKGGWFNPTIQPYTDFHISPAAMVLHYGQAIFEGMKAYRHKSGKIALFRPEKNFERLNNSARRMCMPEVDIDFVLKALNELIKIDSEWVPTKKDHSLYIRPFMVATEGVIGVRPSTQYKFFIILSPVGPYYPEGFKPVAIYATDKYVRAVRKGVGDCKTAGNYGASLLGQVEAKKLGFSQVLWLDAIELKYIEEVGTMNIFVRFKDEVATPMLTGSILPGITRMSTIQVLKDWGYNIQERMISINEIFEGYKNGNLVEMFGTGTAAVISAVSKLRFNDEEIKFSDTEPGELSKKLYEEITGIQFGFKEDKYNWVKFVE